MENVPEKILIITAPSGAGKTSVTTHLLKRFPQLAFSVSAATRPRRDNEINGVDYYFMSLEEFQGKIKNNEFVEWEEVYEGNFYGTLKSEIDRIWKEGKNVIFDVDVKGGLNLKKYFGDRALAIFVKVPSIEVLKERLHDRGTETEESLSRRLFKAEFEMGFHDKFDVVLVNENLDKSLHEAQQLYDDFKKK